MARTITANAITNRLPTGETIKPMIHKYVEELQDLRQELTRQKDSRKAVAQCIIDDALARVKQLGFSYVPRFEPSGLYAGHILVGGDS